MSSSIPSSPGLSPAAYPGTQAEARTKVKKLRNELMKALSGAGLKFFISPGKQLSVSPACRGHASNDIQSLLEAAYPAVDSLEMEMTHRGFATYLSENNLTAEELLGQIHDLHLIQVEEEARKAAQKEEALPFAEDESEKIEGSLSAFLESKEVTLYFNDRVGEGNFGIVVSAGVKGEEDKYVYKNEKRDVSKALTERRTSFWREGDCAAARLHDISHAPKPLFFIFRVSQERGPEELHYVPANHVKAFGMKLPPGTTVFLEGQLMQRAAGESLDKIILKNPTILSSVGGKHFTNIVRGLFNIVQELQAHNLVHRDIKPENIFYNINTGEVTLLDFGSATKLRKKVKADHQSHLYPSTSTELRGTPKYISPKALQQKPYGSEIDLFSFAMTILELVNHHDFTSFIQQRFPDATQGNMRDALLSTCPPREYLDRFLETISDKNSESQSMSLGTQPIFISSLFGSSGSGGAQPAGARGRAQSLGATASGRGSRTERALNRNPSVKEIINLAFCASGGGDEGAAAYEQLQSLPYFQAKNSPVTIDSPPTTTSARTTNFPAIKKAASDLK